MLESHNDSAVAIAEHIAKKYSKNKMNDDNNLFEEKNISSKELVSIYATIMNTKAKDKLSATLLISFRKMVICL